MIALAIAVIGAAAGGAWAVVLMLLGGHPIHREPLELAVLCGAAAGVGAAVVVEVVRLAGG